MRGLILGIPLSLALWGLVYVTARGTVSPDYRHDLKLEAHHVVAAARHEVRTSLGPPHDA